MVENLIEFQNVSKSFGARQILDGVNLQIYDGQTTTIIGKSGSGKSVLLKHIIGLLKPDEGTVMFRGQPITEMSRKEWDDYRSKISFCFQNNALFDSLTIFENIALPLRKTTRLPKKTIKEKVDARIEQMELTEVPYKYPADLSGGMQKRVALARALITDPKIVLFDEPTTGQDPIRKNAILSMIAQYQKKFGFTTIMISHELPDVFFISDRILVLYDKKIIFQGDYRELQELRHPFVDEFIKSLEGVRDELTGLHSREGFENRYNKVMDQKEPREGFSMILFSVKTTSIFKEYSDHTLHQQFIKSLGSQINAYFGDRGFSNRFNQDQFMSILPTTGIDDAELLLKNFGSAIQAQGIVFQKDNVHIQGDKGEKVIFQVMAGLTEGAPSEDIEKVSVRALENLRVIAEF